MKKSGIYKIQSITEPEKFYIGSSVNIQSRKRQHYSMLKLNKHDATYLQNYYNKYGKESLVFHIIEECCQEKLIQREQYYIDILNPVFNSRKNAESNYGHKFSEESKQNMSKAQKKWRKDRDFKTILSEEQINNIKELNSKGCTLQEISNELLLSFYLIRRELKRLNLINYERKLNEQKVKEIKKLISLNYSFKSIGNKYEVSESVISNINAGRMWKNVEFDNKIIVDVEDLEQSTFLSSKNIEDIKIKMLSLTGKHGELKELSKELNIPYSKLIDIKRNKTWVNHGM